MVAGLVVVVTQPEDAPVPAPPQAAEPAAPSRPACAGIVAGLSPRDRLAQRLMVGVDAGNPAAVTELVRSSQVGGIFLGGSATALLRGGALARVQDVARLPVTVAVGATIRPIDEVSTFLAGARPVQVVAPRTPKTIEVTVEVPVPDLGALDERPAPAQVALHVHRQGLERRDVEHPAPVLRGDAGRGFGGQPVQRPEERGQRLARAGRRDHQCMPARRARALPRSRRAGRRAG